MLNILVKSFFNVILLLIILFGSSRYNELFSQNNDSAEIKTNIKDTLKILSFKEPAFDNNFTLQPFDTSLTGIQKYKLINTQQPFKAKFSNSGFAYRDLVFNSAYNFGHLSCRQYFKDYFFTNENAEYFSASEPFADIYYVMGAKREQIFNVLFTRNIKKNLNLSANYKLIHSPGKYTRQKSDDAFVIFTSNYKTKNGRYTVLGNYFYNRIKLQENGGIRDDSVFINNIETNRQLIPVNLNNVENCIKESGFYIKQFYFPVLRKKNKDDTLKTANSLTGLGCISHKILFKNQSYLYSDNNPVSGYYPYIFLDSTITHDSIHLNTIRNTIEWSNLRLNKNININQPFIISIALTHKYSKIFDSTFIDTSFTLLRHATDTFFISLIPEINLCYKFNNKIKITANGFYILQGYNKEDFSVSASMIKSLKKDSLSDAYFGFKADYFRQSPLFFDKYYSSNHFLWNYNFEPSVVKKASFYYNHKTFNTHLSFFAIQHYIYYGYSAMPAQCSNEVNVMQLALNKKFVLNRWEFDNKILCQKTYGSNVIRLPELMSNHAIYFSSFLFKRALTAQLGVEATFFSSYYPNAYMPATREFYMQNEFKSDNYPFIDFFVNLKIKRARIYLKLDHLNSGLMGYNYFMIPHYPMSDRTFKFGISWIFYN